MKLAGIFLGAWLCLMVSTSTSIAASGFAEVLVLADLDPNGWPEFEVQDADEKPVMAVPAANVCHQLLHRLNQFPSEKLQGWAAKIGPPVERGQLVKLRGEIISATELTLSRDSPVGDSGLKLFLCQYKSNKDELQGYVLVPQIPGQWHSRTSLREPARFLGLILQENSQDAQGPLLLANHIQWYPAEKVNSGLILLAEQGMDVSLLDEVRHRRPFVKPSVSREGEAFYACLAALGKVDRQELARLSLKSVASVADDWKQRVTADKEQLQLLREKQESLGPDASRKELAEEITNTRRKLAIAAAVEKQAARKVSSVAPLFLQPEKEAGQLVRIEGIARRAVRIVSENSSITEYFELEVFTSDSQNLPVVCCATSMPGGFPTGDIIREKVRIDGIFFKSWRYRSRKNLDAQGQTARQQQLYTPIVVGREPVWMTASAQDSTHWAIVGGLGVLLAFGVFWVQIVRSSRRVERDGYSIDPSKLKQHLESDSTEHSLSEQ